MTKNRAITIGINGYRYLQKLNYAMQDAVAMRQFFGIELDFQEGYHFTDGSGPIKQDYGPPLDSRPTYTALRRFFNKRFEKPFLGDGDNLWFFFAGHGIRYNQCDYLMPMDGDRNDLENTAIPMYWVSDRLRRSGADNIILLIDACRSFEGSRSGIGIGQEKQQGVITLFSCSPEESSYEIQELKQGAFTHALMESLRIQGEGNCATVERLYQRLRYSVPQITNQYKRIPQTPYSVIEPTSKNHLILLPKQATLADVDILKNDALKAEIQEDFKEAKQLWIRVLAASPADSDAIDGIERLLRKTDSTQLMAQSAAPHTAASNVSTSGNLGLTTSAPSEKVEQNSPTEQDDKAHTSINSEEVDIYPREQKSESESSARRLPLLGARAASPNSLSSGISRRRAIQMLGFAGGGIGVVWLGKRFVSDDSKTVGFDIATLNVQDGSIFDVTRGKGTMHTEKLHTGIALELMKIPGGRYLMGSALDRGNEKEQPQHEVSIRPFFIGRYQVTQAQWKAAANYPKIKHDLYTTPSNWEGDNRPVDSVSWDEAVEFCNRLSANSEQEYRLPSEAEWEYACRAGTNTPFHFGDGLNPDLSNYDSAQRQTMDVGNLSYANAFGLYDMHGNVLEWCSDYWHDSYNGAPSDGSAWTESGRSSERVQRGGSWRSESNYCRSAFRFSNAQNFKEKTVGFRVVCSSWA